MDGSSWESVKRGSPQSPLEGLSVPSGGSPHFLKVAPGSHCPQGSDAVDGTEREEESRKGDTPMEKPESRGGEAQRGPYVTCHPGIRPSVHHGQSSQGPKDAWNPKAGVLRSGPQASCPPDPAPAPPDEVPNCPPLSGPWGSTFKNLTKPTYPVPCPCHHQHIRPWVSCSPHVCPSASSSHPTTPCPHPRGLSSAPESRAVPRRPREAPSPAIHMEAVSPSHRAQARFLPDKQLPPVGTSL